MIAHHNPLSSQPHPSLFLVKDYPPQPSFSPYCIKKSASIVAYVSLILFSHGYGNQQHSLNEYLCGDVATLRFISILMYELYEIPQDVIMDYVKFNPEQFDTISLTCSLGRKYKRARIYLIQMYLILQIKRGVKYDRERAYKCVMSDWLCEVARFPDKHFECVF
jgi:hypothetical protein